MNRITWGVDGYGHRHFFCEYFGKVDPDKIEHECDTSKPQYHNRGASHHNSDVHKFNRNASVFDGLNE